MQPTSALDPLFAPALGHYCTLYVGRGPGNIPNDRKEDFQLTTDLERRVAPTERCLQLI